MVFARGGAAIVSTCPRRLVYIGREKSDAAVVGDASPLNGQERQTPGGEHVDDAPGAPEDGAQ